MFVWPSFPLRGLSRDVFVGAFASLVGAVAAVVAGVNTLTVENVPHDLEQVAPGVYIRPLLTLSQAINLFLTNPRLTGRKTVADYERILDKFTEPFPLNTDAAKITDEDILRFLSTPRRAKLSASTKAWEEMVLSSFFKFLYQTRKIKQNPMEFVPRTRRPDPESLDLVSVSSADVRRMLEACRSWPEKLCLGVLAYTGARRHAVSELRLSDYDVERGRLRFREKGGKTIWKPVPGELAALIGAAMSAGVYQDGAGGETARVQVVDVHPSAGPNISTGEPQAGQVGFDGQHPSSPVEQDGVGGFSARLSSGVGASGRNPGLSADPDPYLVPNEGARPHWAKPGRDDRIIWRIVKTVADRAGVDCHVHALRSAFVDFCFDNGYDQKTVQMLVGHKSPSTTQRYERRWDKQARMEQVRTLSWGTPDGT